MLFNSLSFVTFNFFFVFLFWSVKNTAYRNLILLSSSLIFYAWSFWPALILFGFMLVLNYFLGIAIDKKKSKHILFLAVAVNLSVLVFFKYSNFMLENLKSVCSLLSFDLQVPEYSYWLPLGISFYTFQMIAYLVDVYRGDVESEKSFLVFAVFKSFYAQLVAGPIIRASELLPQLKRVNKFDPEKFKLGLYYIVAGLFIKVVIADSIAQFVNYGFANPELLNASNSWASLYGFTVQILSDFWGYSTIAMGVGLLYGIKLPVNFKNPYAARSIGEFWRTWHITLSDWLRDYLYFPLGGGRKHKYRNIIITLSLAGLWHGASWNFVFYGFFHGLWLSCEKKLQEEKISLIKPILIKQLLVFQGVSLLRVFFRAEDFPSAVLYFKSLAGFYSSTRNVPGELVTLILTFFFFNYFFEESLRKDSFLKWSLCKQVIITIIFICAILAFAESKLDFIYFEF